MSRTTNEVDRLATRNIRNVLVIARQAQGRSLSDVADHIGVQLQQLSRWEQATAAMPNIDSLCRWADALGYEIALLPKAAETAATVCGCTCCLDAVQRIKHDRPVHEACNCADYPPNERCDCPFCTLGAASCAS